MTSINNNVVVTNRTVTLESLARERNVSVEALKKHNNITGDTVPANTAVRIPTAKDLAALGLEANNRVSSGPAPEGSVSAASLKAADDSRSKNQVVGFLRGAWGGLTDLAKGVKDMAVGAVNLTGVRGPAEQAKTMTTLKNVATTVAKDPGAVWDAIKEPYVQAWQKGEYGEAFGRGAFDVITTIGTAGWGGAAKTGVQAGTKFASAASVAAKTAKTANKLDDVVRVSDTIGDAGRTARTATASTGASRQLAVSKGLKRSDDVADAPASSRTAVATSGTERAGATGATGAKPGATTSGAKPGATSSAKPGAAALDDAAVRAAMDDPAKIDALANLMQSAGGKSSTVALLRNYAARVRSGGTDLGSINELATARRMAEKSLRAGAERTDDVGRVIRESLAPRARPNPSGTAGTAGTASSRTSAGSSTAGSSTAGSSTAGSSTAGARTAGSAGASTAGTAGRTSRTADNATRTADSARAGAVAERATAAQGSLADRLQRAGVGAAIVASVAATRVGTSGVDGSGDAGATELFDANNPAHLAALQTLINDGNAPGVEAMLEGVPPEVVQQIMSGGGTSEAEDAEWDASISLLAQALAYSGISLDDPELPGLLSKAMNPEAAAIVLEALRESEGALPSGSVAGSELSIAPVDPAVLGQLSASQSRVVDAGTAPHEVAPGETLESIARAYDTTPEQLLALNPGLEELEDLSGLMVQVPVGSSDMQAEAAARPLPTTGANAYATEAPAIDAIRDGTSVMQRGMSGPSVMDVQRALNAAGASPPLALDGKFGPKTEAALKDFQSRSGVQQTGVLGAPSLRKLEEAPEAPSTRTQRTDRATLTGSALGTTIGDRAEREARRLGSVGACALGVNNTLTSLGIGGRGHAYQKAEQLARDSRFREVNLSPSDLSSLPRGAVVVWGRSAAKPYGHVSVAMGNGTEASDHIQAQIRGGRYGTDFGRGPDAQGRQCRVFMPA